MSYPVGRPGRTLDPLWYDAQPFGTPTSYGFHEGPDYNLKTGGNSDLGQPLYAVADGKIVYYHNSSHPTKNFGRHMVLECETSRGKRWYHYAHCQEITATIKTVKEGDIIGKVGISGTTVAHLHFAVYKVDPSTLPQGIDTIAKTKQQLNDWWEPFEVLSTQEPMPDTALQECLRQHAQLVTELEAEKRKSNGLEEQTGKLRDQIGELEGKFNGAVTRAKSAEDNYQRLIDSMAQKLGSVADEGRILEQIERDVSEIDNATKKAKELERQLVEQERKNKDEIETLKGEILKLKNDNDKQLKRIDTLEKRVMELCEQEYQVTLFDKIRAFLDQILKKG